MSTDHDLEEKNSPSPVTPFEQDIHSKDPRVCFISLFYLYKHWTNIPFSVLFESIVILYCRREWIFGPADYSQASLRKFEQLWNDKSGISNVVKLSQMAQCPQFVTFLRNKETQKRLLWVEPNSNKNKSQNKSQTNDETIDHRWSLISDFLVTIDSPVTNTNFERIITSIDWWKKKYEQQLSLACKRQTISQDWWDVLCPLQYSNHFEIITKELKRISWNFKAVLEIIQQANPTIVPMMAYEKERLEQKKRIFSTALAENPNKADVDTAILHSWKMRTPFLIEKRDGTVYLK